MLNPIVVIGDLGFNCIDFPNPLRRAGRKKADIGMAVQRDIRTDPVMAMNLMMLLSICRISAMTAHCSRSIIIRVALPAGPVFPALITPNLSALSPGVAIPSAVSARPSRCKPPDTAAKTVTTVIAPILWLKIAVVRLPVAYAIAPMMSPITGNQTVDFANTSSG